MPETANPEHQLTSLLVRTMALLCVRNTMIEDIHAGLVPVTRTGDYSDITVIDADGGGFRGWRSRISTTMRCVP